MRVVRNAGLCEGKGGTSTCASKGCGSVKEARDVLHYVWDYLEPRAEARESDTESHSGL